MDSEVGGMLGLLMVAALAALDLWLALPVILAADIATAKGAAVAAAGSAVGATAATWASVSFRAAVMTHLQKRPGMQSRIQRFMDRYGTAGVGLLGPIILGSALSCIGAIALGAEPRKLALYAAIGSAAWAVVLALILGSMRQTH